MRYTNDPRVMAAMAQLDDAKKAAKEDARVATKLRAPLVKTMRRLRSKLDYCQRLRCRMIFGNGVCISEDEVTAERIHGQRWRDNNNLMEDLSIQLRDSEIALLLQG